MCRAAETTSAGPAGVGAVNPGRCAPSLPTALPEITASTGSRSASASASRRNTTTPTPEPTEVPDERASNARQ